MFLLSAPFHIFYPFVSYPSLIGFLHLLLFSMCLIPNKTYINFIIIKFCWGTKHIYPKHMSPPQIFKDNESFGAAGAIEGGRGGNMIFIVKRSQFMHKRHLNQFMRNISNEADSGPLEETVVDVIYDSFNIPTPV